MKFGIFYEHQLPRPWSRGQRAAAHQRRARPDRVADELGIQYVWEVEHHFLEEYSHSSAPEVFLAAASQRTKNMRIGHGIIQTAPGYNHPARTAERVAMLDLVSNGRVEFGSGESASEAELGGFGIDPAVKREAWLEGLEVALRCMTETPFTGVDGTVRADAAPQRGAQAGPEAAPPAVGGVQPPRHHPAGRREGHRRPQLRLHRARRRPPVGGRLRGDPAHQVRPGRPGGQPAGGVRDPDDVRPRRDRRHRPRPRGRQLLRLLARPLLRVRRAPPGGDQRVGGVRGAPREDGLLARGRHRRPQRRRSGPRPRPAT